MSASNNNICYLNVRMSGSASSSVKSLRTLGKERWELGNMYSLAFCNHNDTARWSSSSTQRRQSRSVGQEKSYHALFNQNLAVSWISVRHAGNVADGKGVIRVFCSTARVNQHRSADGSRNLLLHHMTTWTNPCRTRKRGRSGSDPNSTASAAGRSMMRNHFALSMAWSGVNTITPKEQATPVD